MAETIKIWDTPALISLPLAGASALKGIKKGRSVSAGQTVAVSEALTPRGIHSPINGIIYEIHYNDMIIERDDNAIGEPPHKKNIHNLADKHLAMQLSMLGLKTPEIYPGDDIVISALDPEPGLHFAQAIFDEHRESINAAIEAVKLLWPGKKIIWAVPQKINDLKYEQHLINNIYPDNNAAHIKKKIFSRNDHQASGILSAAYLFLLGRLWRTGLPLTHFPLSLANSNYLVPLGSRIIDLLSFANLYPRAGDTVIVGGLIKGRSVSRLEQGVTYDAGALNLLRHYDRPRREACRGCRLCRKHCPGKIALDFIGPRSFNECMALNLNAIFKNCILCGHCAYICPSGRPLLSLARLAKIEGDDI